MFEVGQKVRFVEYDREKDWKSEKGYLNEEGVIINDSYMDSIPYLVEFKDGQHTAFKEYQLELITNPKEVSMPPMYILKKETVSCKKGAVLKAEGCVKNGDYRYVLEDIGYFKFPNQSDAGYFDKEEVEKQPDWFEKIELVPVPANKMAQIKKILKGK